MQVWYSKPQNFRDAISEVLTVNPDDLSATHVHLFDIPATDEEQAYWNMQGEVWSPNGEANQLIRENGLSHTSMSVGDILVKDSGEILRVAFVGFETLKQGKQS